MRALKAILAALLLIVACACEAGINNPGNGGSPSPPTGVAQVVVNPGSSGQAYLNLAHTLLGGSTQAGWPGTLTANGYPTSATTSAVGLNTLLLISNYYGRYKIWWTGTGAFQLAPAMIVYSGGTGTQLNTASGSVDQNLAIGFAGSSTQPTSAAPVEVSFGALLSAIADNGSGFVRITSTGNGFANTQNGNTYQINNVTNLAPGPYTVTAHTNATADLNIAFNGTMAVVAGSPGTKSEAILNIGGTTWNFPSQGSFSASYSSFDGLVICRSQNVGTGGLSDCANVATHHVNPDYVSLFKAPGLNPRFIRVMDYSGVQGGFSTSFTYRPQTSTLFWGKSGNPQNFVKDYWAGLLTNVADTYTSASNPTASPASGPPVDGEIATGYIDVAGVNTTTVPKLAINRASFGAAKPIITGSFSTLNLTMSGSVPPTGSTITLLFTGGGLATPLSYTYLTSTSVNGPGGVLDNSLNNIAINIRFDLNNNTRGNSAAFIAAKMVSANPEITNAHMAFKYNPNINSAGVASLGSGLTIAGSDNGGAGTVYNLGYVNVGYLPNNHNFTFIYSTVAQAWISEDPGNSANGPIFPGPHGGPPLEFYEDWCLQANIGLWLNIQMLYPDAAIASTVTHLANSGIKELVLEMSNETWNTGGGGQWGQFDNFGVRLGFRSSFNGGPSMNALTGLRTIQMANAAIAAWTSAGRSASQIFISNAYQFVSLDQTDRLNGASLTPASNVTLAAFGGSPSNGTATPTAWATNSSVFPNRPVDWGDFISPAPYLRGVQFNSSFGGSIVTSVPLAAYNCSLVASYNYANGNAGEQSAALDFMFNGTSGDFYTLTGLNGGSINNNQQLKTWAHGSGNSAADYFGIPTIVAGYDAVRTGTNPHKGIPWSLLGVAAYEGDGESGPTSPTEATTIAGNLTTLGDTSGYTSGLGASCGMTPHVGGPTSSAATDATNMATLLLAFKNDNRYKLLYLQYFNDFVAAVTSQGNRIALPSTYGFDGGGNWGKYPGSIYTTPYKSLDAITAFDN